MLLLFSSFQMQTWWFLVYVNALPFNLHVLLTGLLCGRIAPLLEPG